ncbi:MAG: alpha/beta fold hydrolase [bacterium]|nr:alpha/beta fold hydrolase [bacterium]
MKRIFIIHGWAGNSKSDWLPWLKSELEKLGYKVFVPDMPDTENPVIGKWVNHLRDLVETPDKDTYFVGHSIGCQTILRYLETVSTPVGKAVFIAGWFDLKNLEDDEAEKIAEPWITTPIDIAKVRKVLPSSTVIISDNDPFGTFEENKKKFVELGSKIIILHNAGHIDKESSYTKLPEALEEFKKL